MPFESLGSELGVGGSEVVGALNRSESGAIGATLATHPTAYWRSPFLALRTSPTELLAAPRCYRGRIPYRGLDRQLGESVGKGFPVHNEILRRAVAPARVQVTFRNCYVDIGPASWLELTRIERSRRLAMGLAQQPDERREDRCCHCVPNAKRLNRSAQWWTIVAGQRHFAVPGELLRMNATAG